MMDDDEYKSGVTQIPLMHDLIFDPLRPPDRSAQRPRKRKHRSPDHPPQYSPHSDPDTIDLFGDITTRTEPDPVLANQPQASQDPGQIGTTGNADTPATKPLNSDLRGELTDQLSAILNDLAEPKSV